jgi:HlyD family secretion protein
MSQAITLRSTAVLPAGERFDDDVATEKRWGWILITLFFGLFLGWSLFIRLDAAAYATGTVAVAGNRQVVQHRDGGIVSAIHVKEGQRVKAGQILIELSSAEVVASERALSSQVIRLQSERARLLAERLGGDIIAPPEFLRLAGLDRAEADKAMALQRQELEVRRRALSDQKMVLNQQAGQLALQASGYQQRIAANHEQSSLFNDELAGMKKLEAKGFASTNRVRALERARADMRGQTATLAASAASARQEIGEKRIQALTLDSQYAQQVSEQLRSVEATLDDVLPRYRAAKEQLDKTQIRATASGQVVGLDVFTVGGVIGAGQKLMEIVPDAAPLVVQAQVSPNDADDLYVGQKTEIRIPALHERDIPVLEGKITRLSADSFTDERTGIRYYTATVTVPVAEIEEIRKIKGSADGIKPGLPVEVLVPLRKRTLFQYLVEPINQALWRSFREH